ncbi:MAG TPA: MarR family transcriptional regulator [Solirubrobacteraceae bacterium]|jgi:DNA-binding MarR family transcriptional regulator|nr:MarR family transcriptional regulator [Solirubrobacteraceae bacterium]
MEAGSDHVAHLIEQWAAEAPGLPLAPVSVIARILRAAQHLDHEITRGLSAYGLGNREFDVLSVLRRSGPPYMLTASELRREILFSSGGLTKLLERLERNGLIAREQDPKDRRVVRVVLTDAGRELQQAAMDLDLQLEERLLAPLDDQQRQALAELLQGLLVSLELADTRWPLRQRQPAMAPRQQQAVDHGSG